MSIFFTLCGVVSSTAQTVVSMEKEGIPVAYKVEKGDTVYYVRLREVVVHAPRKFKSKAEERQYWKLVYNVKKVYPYAKLAGRKLHELNEHYLELDSEKERKAYGKQAEESLKAEFEGELRKLTISQGRILLRLVDRETGNTTFEILKDFRGSLSAVFWQTVAKIFGSNLKTRYDPSSGEDKIIEQIIAQIDEGSI
ncbi:MAG: DUF4294 domain-containing protein [Bacteroidales bacterium]|jgi:hypothetical protein|nr:DUF4294 domain-containing protein [Bacteroidales bacterium]